MGEKRMVHSAASGFIPVALVAALALTVLGGCTIEKTAERPVETPAFLEVARTYRENFASFPTTAALVQETATGCLYSVAEGKGASAVTTPDGRHAGCLTRKRDEAEGEVNQSLRAKQGEG